MQEPSKKSEINNLNTKKRPRSSPQQVNKATLSFPSTLNISNKPPNKKSKNEQLDSNENSKENGYQQKLTKMNEQFVLKMENNYLRMKKSVEDRLNK